MNMSVDNDTGEAGVTVLRLEGDLDAASYESLIERAASCTTPEPASCSSTCAGVGYMGSQRPRRPAQRRPDPAGPPAARPRARLGGVPRHVRRRGRRRAAAQGAGAAALGAAGARADRDDAVHRGARRRAGGAPFLLTRPPAPTSTRLRAELEAARAELAAVREELARTRGAAARDLALARRIQRSLLPRCRSGAGGGWPRRAEPAYEVGGDYYDAFAIPRRPGRLGAGRRRRHRQGARRGADDGLQPRRPAGRELQRRRARRTRCGAPTACWRPRCTPACS